MSIIRWSPFEELSRWFDEDAIAAWARFPWPFPAALPVDVYRKGNNLVVEAQLPGVDPKNVAVSVENNTLTIRGKLDERKEVKDKDYFRREIRTGEIVRTVPLPATVQSNKAEAEFSNGTLKITIPVAPTRKAKAVKVKVRKQ
jgi:HSP20 family protein